MVKTKIEDTELYKLLKPLEVLVTKENLADVDYKGPRLLGLHGIVGLKFHKRFIVTKKALDDDAAAGQIKELYRDKTKRAVIDRLVETAVKFLETQTVDGEIIPCKHSSKTIIICPVDVAKVLLWNKQQAEGT